MKPQTAKQQLANAIRRMKAKGESESQKKLLKDVKAHIRNKFKESVDYQIIKQGKSRAAAEAKALETALFRVESWMGY
ncbi:hypothetical protein [Kingella oralis]|jgi:hypothetical protein|nr:MAG TPA: hypothetical protein [Caudoviricetes sp.]